MKKILIFAGVGVVGYVGYRAWVARTTATAVPGAQVPPPSPIDTSIAAGARDHRTMADSELGMSQDLGSLGGAYR